MTVFSKQIERYRKFIGYSDEQLIELTGITRERFLKIIEGTVQPYLKQLIKISDTLKVPLQYLIDSTKDYSFEYHICWLDDIL